MAWNRRGGHESTPRSETPERQDWHLKGRKHKKGRDSSGSELWRRGDQPTPRRSLYRYLVKMIGITAILGVLLGMWFVYVTRKHRQVPLLTICITKYESSLVSSSYTVPILPPNSFAEEDRQLFERTFQRQTGSGLTRNVGAERLIRDGACKKADLLSAIQRRLSTDSGKDAVEPGGPDNDVVMFYISAHGAVDDQGEACLLMSDSDPLDSSTWVTLREVLELLKTTMGTSRKIVFLDASRMCENWQMGILCNTFPERIGDAVQKVADPNLVVCNSASLGESVWAEPEQACTSFGRIVADALAGAGDDSPAFYRWMGWSDISLRRLSEEITRETQKRSQEHRASIQTPAWYYLAGTMELDEKSEYPDWVLADSAAKTADVPPQAELDKLRKTMEQRAKEVGELWQELDKLAAQEVVHSDPLQWAAFPMRLRRAEALMLAGSQYDKDYEEAVSALRTDLPTATARQDQEKDGSQIASLAYVRNYLPRSISQDDLKKFRSLWEKDQNADAEPWKAAPYLAAMVVGTQWLEKIQPNPTRENLRAVLKLADRCRGNRPHDVVELQFLKMLAEDTLPQAPLQTPIAVAMKCRFLAERAASPPDPRAVYWIDAVVNQADANRRTAEDRLFLGVLPTEAGDTWNDLTTQYKTAEKTGEDLAEILRLRDQIWAELLPLAQWKLRETRSEVTARATTQSPSGESVQPDDELAAVVNDVQSSTSAFEVLSDLIRRTSELDIDLKRSEETLDIAELLKRSKDLKAELTALRRQFNDSVAREFQDIKDADSLRRMTVILSSSLRCGVSDSATPDPERSRGNLLQRFVACLFDYQKGKEGESQAGKIEEGTEIGYVRALQQGKQHPLRSLLAGSDVPEADLSDSDQVTTPWAKQEVALRKFLKTGLPDKLKSAIDETASLLRSSDKEQKDPTLEAHNKLWQSGAEGLYRRWAPVAVPVLSSPDLDPALLERRLASLHLLLWQRERALNDCYLTPRNNSTFVERASRGFREAARDLRTDLVNSLPPGATPNSPLRLERIHGIDLAELEEKRRGAAGLPATPSAIQLRESDEELLDADSLQEEQLTITVDAAPQLPSDGEGFLSLLNGNQPFGLGNSSAEQTKRDGRLLLEAQQDARTLTFDIRRKDLSDVEELTLRTYFRGAWHQAPIWVRDPAKGIRVVAPLPSYDKPRIKVDGDAKKKVVIVFILDCSYSMDADEVWENQTVKRLEVAQIVLRGILKDLLRYQEEEQGNYRVGLVLYGHRWGYYEENGQRVAGRFAVRPGFEEPRWPNNSGDVHPSNDVEAVFGALVDLSENNVQALNRVIDDVEPWGVTPLNRSLVKAMELVARESSDTVASSHIIAITDGLDQTYAREYNTTVADVEEEAKSIPNLQVDIVGFGLSESYTPKIRELTGIRTEREFKGKMEDLRKMVLTLNKRLGGEHLYFASSPLALKEELRDAIQPAGVQITGKKPGDPQDKELGTSRLGNTWVLDEWNEKWTGLKTDCKVTVKNPRSGTEASADVVLEGGESLQLLYQGNSLIHHSSLELDSSYRNDVSGNFRIAALVPQWEADQVVFRVVVRNADPTRFSPRPKQVWAEITPIGGSDSQQFVFYDLEFENDKELPILMFRTDDWPVGAEKASIRLWFRMDESSQTAELEDSIGKYQPNTRFPSGLAGIELEVEAKRTLSNGFTSYVVWEHYGATHPGNMPTSSVQLIDRPHYVEHQVRREGERGGVVRHVFRYRPGLTPSSPTLQIISKSRICDGANFIADQDSQPLEVTLPTRNR